MIHFTFYKSRLFFLLLFLLLIWQTIKFIPWLNPLRSSDIDHSPSESGTITPVLVTVFYEALCPDSKNFIVKQLLPAINKASRLLNVTLVPYGKAVTEESDGNISFDCQHGPVECLANKIHACAISKISNPILLVRYISCMISDNLIPEMIGETCANKLAIHWKSILQCTHSEKGNLLLKEYGKMTNALNPKISFVPTVLLDNKRKYQTAILKDFFKQVCLLFKDVPEECSLAFYQNN